MFESTNLQRISMFSKRLIFAIYLVGFLYLSGQSPEEITDKVFGILKSGENKDYIGEPISQLEHALQCAKLAADQNMDEKKKQFFLHYFMTLAIYVCLMLNLCPVMV